MFNPAGLYRVGAAFLGPFWWMRYVAMVMALFSAVIALQDWYALQTHIDRVFFSVTFFQKLLMSLFTANLLSKLMVGVAMAMYGVESRLFGIRLMFGFLPRFFTDRSGIRSQSFPRQRKLYSVPLLTKLTLFGFGIFFWAMLRRNGSGAADLALSLGVVGFGSFIFTANPLWRADGYRWMAACFERPDLQKEAFRVLGMVLRRRPLPSALGRAEAAVLFLYGAACIIFTALIVYIVLSALASALEAELQGTGVLIFCILLAMLTLFLLSLRQRKPGSKDQQAQPVNAAAARGQKDRKTGAKTFGAAQGGPTGTMAARIRQPQLTMTRSGTALPVSSPGPEVAAPDSAEAPSNETDTADMAEKPTKAPTKRALPDEAREAVGGLLEDARGEFAPMADGAASEERDPDGFSDLGDLTEEELDADSYMSELEQLLAEDMPEAEAEELPLEEMLADDLDEAELDADPQMSELEALLADDDESAEEIDELAPALEEELDEAEMDADPLMSELEALLAPDDAIEEASGDPDLDPDALEAVLEDDLEEEAVLDDPVMSDLETVITGGRSSPRRNRRKRQKKSEFDDFDQMLDAELDEDVGASDLGEFDDLMFDQPEPALERIEEKPPRAAKAAAASGSTALVRVRDKVPAKRKEILPPEKAAPQYEDLDRVLGRTGVAKPKRSRWKVLLVWLAILAGLIYVALLPYPYEVGGEFIVKPIAQSQVRARTTGEITELNVIEGDWVTTGQVMAILSDEDEKRDIAVRKAEIAGLNAELATLLAGAKPEEIALAEEAVEAANVQIEIAQQDLDRKSQLFERGTITKAALEDAQSALKVAQAAHSEAQARLKLVRSGALQSEVEAKRADIDRNLKDLEFSNLQLENTRVRAVTDGQIVSSLEEVPVGAFLNEGGLFAVLENNREVIAEIEIPETEISEVTLGAKVELKTWSEADVSLWGEVLRVAPRAEERDFGRVIRVSVKVPNPEGALASNMTGFAKVAAGEAPVWEVFSRVLMRFLRVELWSWVP